MLIITPLVLTIQMLLITNIYETLLKKFICSVCHSCMADIYDVIIKESLKAISKKTQVLWQLSYFNHHSS